MYTSINDILKDLTKENFMKYPVKYDNGEYNKEELWNLLSYNFQAKHEYLNVIGNFHVVNSAYDISTREYSETEFVRAEEVIRNRIAVGSYNQPITGEWHPAYLAVLADAEVNGGDNVSPEIVSQLLALEGTVSDFDMIVYLRTLTNKHIIFSFRKNPDFKEFVEHFANIMRLVRYGTKDKPELR